MSNILSLKNVSKRFKVPLTPLQKIGKFAGFNVPEKSIHAVNDVSMEVKDGEVVGLVGESGCGKSTLSRIISGVHSATSGDVKYRDDPVIEVHGKKIRKLATDIQMIFQDPYASLNQRHRIVDIIAEGPVYHQLIEKKNVDAYVCQMMHQAGIDPDYRFRYPHQFSGGQRQRIGIARALAMQPKFLVCDEAVAALDVSIQAQVINLFMTLKENLGLTYLFVSHDLSVVRHISDRVIIMYLGRIVEQARVEDIYQRPNHPYSQALLANMLTLQSRKQKFVTIKGEIPSPLAPPKECAFHPRCPFVMERCKQELPKLKEVSPQHFSACHLNDMK